ncbi:MAG: hypothetical protein ACLU4J_13425 [Butyricimonas paravirosa]
MVPFILNVLNVSYIPYPLAQEGDEKWSYNQLLANAESKGCIAPV